MVISRDAEQPCFTHLKVYITAQNMLVTLDTVATQYNAHKIAHIIRK